MAIHLLVPHVNLAHQLIGAADVTVEAEYGAFVWEGRRYTAAHHQPVGSVYAGRHLPGLREVGRPSPCNDEAIPALHGGGLVGCSHLDLDTFGGLLRTEPDHMHLFGPDTAPFWTLAEAIDVRGPHRLPELGTEVLRGQIASFWAWCRRHDPVPDRVTDVSALVHEAAMVILEAFVCDPIRIAEGGALLEAEAESNLTTFVHAQGRVILRHLGDSGGFVNGLYRRPDGTLEAGVVTWNRAKGSITLSIAEPAAHPRVDCRALAQTLWGPYAGGHMGIAGTPRGSRYAFEEAERACVALRRLLVTL